MGQAGKGVEMDHVKAGTAMDILPKVVSTARWRARARVISKDFFSMSDRQTDKEGRE